MKKIRQLERKTSAKPPGRLKDRMERVRKPGRNAGDEAGEALITHGEFERASSVLEFGCGTGRMGERLLTEFLPAKSRYMGVDINQKMVDLAADRLKGFGPRAEIHLADKLPGLDFKDACFDRFVAASFMEFLLDDEIGAFFKEAKRVLMDGGLLILTSATHGFTRGSKIVETIWKIIDAFRPVLMGGCRPVRLEELVLKPDWEILYNHRFSSFGIPSQVLVARKLSNPESK